MMRVISFGFKVCDLHETNGHFILSVNCTDIFTFLLVYISFLVEIDATALVTGVQDGDTFFSDPVGWIRLADVDAPDKGYRGYDESKEFLAGLIGGKQIYLDIDDYGTTSYGRLICLVYVRQNSTHLLNVNLALVKEGHAIIKDYLDNEFTPDAWTLFVYYPVTYEELHRYKLLLYILAVTTIALMILMIYLVRKKIRVFIIKQDWQVSSLIIFID